MALWQQLMGTLERAVGLAAKLYDSSLSVHHLTQEMLRPRHDEETHVLEAPRPLTIVVVEPGVDCAGRLIQQDWRWDVFGARLVRLEENMAAHQVSRSEARSVGFCDGLDLGGVESLLQVARYALDETRGLEI